MYVWYNTTILLLRQPHRHPFDRHSLDTEASTSRGTCLNYSPSVLSTKSEYDSRTKTVTVYDVRLCVDTFYFDFHPPGRQQFANSSMRRVLYWPRAVYLAAATSRSYNVGVFIWGCKQTKKMFTSKTFGSYLYSPRTTRWCSWNFWGVWLLHSTLSYWWWSIHEWTIVWSPSDQMYWYWWYTYFFFS